MTSRRMPKVARSRKADECQPQQGQSNHDGGKDARTTGVKRTTRRPTMKTDSEATLDGGFYDLKLYVTGQTSKSLRALRNLRTLCGNHLAGRYRIEVIDLIKRPQLAQGDRIVATPTLIRKLPVPVRQLIGDLSNTEKVLVGLDLRPRV